MHMSHTPPPTLFFVLLTLLILDRLFVVSSFSTATSSRLSFVSTISNNNHKNHHEVSPPPVRFAFLQPLKVRAQQQQRSVALCVKSNREQDDLEQHTQSKTVWTEPVSLLGVLATPVVWVSLYFVVTTGRGLPAGPFGLLGALEGLAYLVVVGIAGGSLFPNLLDHRVRPLAQQLSRVTLLMSLLALAALVVDQGCVPNAKPLLDYSAYLPICNPNETPGLFGRGGM